MHRGGLIPHGAGRPIAAVVASVALALGATACAASGFQDPPAAAGDAVVVEPIDGDTVDIRIAGQVERVRLIGVDTPETVARDRPVQCYGPEASAELKHLLPPGTHVRLERDAVPRDRYGRLLAYVHRADDDLFVNLALVTGGFADAVTYGDNEALYPSFAAAEAVAKADGVGLWGACGGPDVPLDEVQPTGGAARARSA